MLGKRIVLSLGLLSVLLFIFLAILITPFTQPVAPNVSSPLKRSTAEAQARAFYSQLGMVYEGNIGQFDSEILFVARGVDHTTFITQTGPVFSVSYSLPAPTNLTTPNYTPYAYVGDVGSIEGANAMIATYEARKQHQRQWTIRMEFVGANLQPNITGEGKKESSTRYFKGDQSNWGKPVSNFSSIRYANLYNGLDFLVYSDLQHIRYFIVAAAGSDIGQLRFQFQGADHLALDADGNLLIFTGESMLPPFQLNAPFSYQMVNNLQTQIPSKFMIDGNTVSFELAEYDKTLPLTIN